MFIVTAIVTIILALAFLGAGGSKLAGQQQMKDAAVHFGIPWKQYQGIGALEILGAVGLLIGLAVAPLGIAAATGLVLVMVGAVTFHLRFKDPVSAVAPAIVILVVSIIGLILRSATA